MREKTRFGMLMIALVSMAGTSADAQGVRLLEIGQSAGRPTSDREVEDLVALARRTCNERTGWRAGMSLTDARNAHSTNTKQHMREALEHGYNWLEGDLREEINEPHAMEMRHDEVHESGDNLTLRQWLEIGQASGRGLKLDVKEPEHMERILSEVQAWGIPQERLMFNLGFSSMDTWGEKIRAGFPGSWLAINPPSGEGKLSASQVARMLAQARKFPGMVTFVVRWDLLDTAAIEGLEAAGPVSVWNSPYDGPEVDDPAQLAAKLRRQGVTGVIDLRKSVGLGGQIGRIAGFGLNSARTGIDRGIAKAEDLAVDAGRGIVSGVTGAAGAIGSVFGL